MKKLSILFFVLLSGCASTNHLDSRSKSCGFRFGLAQYSNSGVYFDYNCQSYKTEKF